MSGFERRANGLFVSAGILVAVLSSGEARAQGTTVLEGITIYSANRTPTDAAKVGSSVEVLTEKDLEKQSRTFLKDYLDQLTGVYFTQDGPPGQTSSISLRGASNRYVKVLIDGMDLSDPTGITTQNHYQHLLVGDIARVEVLKGSQSTLYGGDAVGGVISIETKAARTPGFSQSAGAEYGTYNTLRGAYTAGFAAADGSNIALTVQGYDSDGFSASSAGTEDDGYENVTVSGRGTYRISDAVSVFFAARTLDATVEFDDFGADGFNLSDTVQHAGRVGADITLLGGALKSTVAVQGMKIERDFDEPLGFPPQSSFDGDRVKAEYQSVLAFNNRLALLAGADWEETGFETNNVLSRKTASVGGVFAQLMMEPIDGLVLTGGGRMDEHSTFGDFHTHRLTGAYLVPGTDTKLRASYGTGFRAPALDELFGAYPLFGLDFYGNPDLTPEESESWDVGVEQGLLANRLRLSATYFELDTDNAISFTGGCVPGDPCLRNEPGITERKGVELSGYALVTDGLAVSAGYTWIDAELPNGNRVPKVPRHSLTAGLDWTPWERTEFSVRTTYVADVFESAFVELDDYVLVSAKAAYEFLPGWRAYVRGENLLDEDYETVAGFSTAGLSVFGGIEMALPSE